MNVDVNEFVSIPVAASDAEGDVPTPLLLVSFFSGFQITSRRGKSFVQLLTRSAVLIEFGHAVQGGGMGLT